MKSSIIFTFLFSFISVFAFGQDSTTYRYVDTTAHQKNYKITYKRDPAIYSSDTATGKIKRYKVTYSKKTQKYRPTRLGSSSPLYDTYKKNDNGAGAITTNPNKSAGFGSPVISYPLKADSVKADSTVKQ